MNEICPGFTSCSGCNRLLRNEDGPTCTDCLKSHEAAPQQASSPAVAVEIPAAPSPQEPAA